MQDLHKSTSWVILRANIRVGAQGIQELSLLAASSQIETTPTWDHLRHMENSAPSLKISRFVKLWK